MIALAKEISDEKECMFVLSGMLVFADKIIDSEISQQVKEWIRMTKIGKLYEQKKIEYANRKCADEIIDMCREDGKSDEEIILRLKKGSAMITVQQLRQYHPMIAGSQWVCKKTACTISFGQMCS